MHVGNFLCLDTRSSEQLEQLRDSIIIGAERFAHENANMVHRYLNRHPFADPMAFWNEHNNEHNNARKSFGPQYLVCPVMDFNNYLSFGRAGVDEKRTFLPQTEVAWAEAISRFGSCNIGTALTTSQMVSHLAKHPRFAMQTIVSCENGLAWGFTSQTDKGLIMREYQAQLSSQQRDALTFLKNWVEHIASEMRILGLCAFVNFGKFSKCTMEAGHNGKAWYEKTAREILLPWLAQRGAQVDFQNKSFVLSGVAFQVSLTNETWEIDMKRGADTVGKRMIRNIFLSSLEDLVYTQAPEARFKMLTGGDSAKWGGSDAALTDNNYPIVGFWAPPEERSVTQLLGTITEASVMARYYWPGFVEDFQNPRLYGAGLAPALYLEYAPYAMPCLYIPMTELEDALLKRITQHEGFEQVAEWDLANPPPLYDFPQDISAQQKELFLASAPDLPEDGGEEVIALLKARLKLSA